MLKSVIDSMFRRSSGDALLATVVRATPLSMLGHVVNVTLALIAFHDNAEPAPLLLWAAVSYGVGAWVFLRWVTRRKRRARQCATSSSRAARRAVIFGVVLGAPWGILGFWLLGDLPQQRELILIALCLGMSASGSVLLSATYPSAITYMVCILLPIVIKCFVLKGGEYHMLGALTLSYSVFLLNCIGSCAKLFADRSRAVDELRQSLLTAETAKQEVERANDRFEAALRNMPQGLVMFDGGNCLEAFNDRWIEMFELPRDKLQIGMKLEDVVEMNADRCGLQANEIEWLLNDRQKGIEANDGLQRIVQLTNGRSIQVTVRLGSEGGWVATQEDITQRKASEEEIAKLAHYDSLTGLANRNLFKERIEQALARYRRLKAGFAVLLLDLDRFKAVNDTFGHQSGDALLREVANRIRAEIREVDTAARIGGDEFALLIMPGQDSLKAGAAALASRLIEAIAAPFRINDKLVTIGCSVGIAVVPEHGERIDEALRNADLALYKSKNEGRNRVSLYSPDLKADADRRNVLEIELREAIWREEIDVFYQPVVDLNSGKVKSVEALARWRHKKKGLVPPAEFIPVAEEAGLIGELGNLVLAKACRDATAMPGDIKVAVNLSAMQFANGAVVDSVIFGLVDSGLAERRLELEITEGVFLADSEENLETLRRLKNLGVSIALDDFGVGYSSLSYLTAFPFNKVKIDKSFVDRIDRAETIAVLASIVQLGKTLNLSVVAEGLESAEQVERIRSLGIELGQGYFLGRPAPLTDLELAPRKLVVRKAVA